jgi:hypothetical protein
MYMQIRTRSARSSPHGSLACSPVAYVPPNVSMLSSLAEALIVIETLSCHSYSLASWKEACHGGAKTQKSHRKTVRSPTLYHVTFTQQTGHVKTTNLGSDRVCRNVSPGHDPHLSMQPHESTAYGTAPGPLNGHRQSLQGVISSDGPVE